MSTPTDTKAWIKRVTAAAALPEFARPEDVARMATEYLAARQLLETTLGNIRSLGPAGAWPAYECWVEGIVAALGEDPLTGNIPPARLSEANDTRRAAGGAVPNRTVQNGTPRAEGQVRA